MPLALKGVNAQVKWYYHEAARLNGYHVTRAGGKWRLTGTVAASDGFRLSRRPLLFVATYARKNGEPREWMWPIEEFDISKGRITAHLGAPLE